MAGDAGVEGPLPEGVDPVAYDRLRRRVLWLMPSGLYLVGSAAAAEANLMTTNWASQVSVSPKLVAVAVEAEAVTHRLVAASGAFSINILAREDRTVVRRFVKPAHWDAAAATLNGFPVQPGCTGAPILSQAAAWLDCRVSRQIPLGSHTLFIGEIADCGVRRAEEVPVLRMEDTRMSYGG